MPIIWWIHFLPFLFTLHKNSIVIVLLLSNKNLCFHGGEGPSCGLLAVWYQRFEGTYCFCIHVG
jgi:hypothetical protein